MRWHWLGFIIPIIFILLGVIMMVQPDDFNIGLNDEKNQVIGFFVFLSGAVSLLIDLTKKDKWK